MAVSSDDRSSGKNPLLTIPEVIAEIGVARATFYRWRQLRKGPRPIKLPNGDDTDTPQLAAQLRHDQPGWLARSWHRRGAVAARPVGLPRGIGAAADRRPEQPSCPTALARDRATTVDAGHQLSPWMSDAPSNPAPPSAGPLACRRGAREAVVKVSQEARSAGARER